MGGRPWLEALKEHCDRREQGRGTRDAIFADAPDDEPTKPTKACTPVVDIDAARAGFARDDDERRLLAAGWEPKERMGLVIWANPETGFYCSQEVALHRLGQGEGARRS
jgi:hypothetical protein